MPHLPRHCRRVYRAASEWQPYGSNAISTGTDLCLRVLQRLTTPRLRVRTDLCLRVLHRLATPGLRVRVLHPPAMQPRRKGTFHTGLSLFIFIEASASVAGIVQPTAQCTYNPRQATRLSGCTSLALLGVVHAAGTTPWIIHAGPDTGQAWHRRVVGYIRSAISPGP